MDFTEHQRLFLRTICTYFHEHADWPKYGWLDRTLRKYDKGIDVQALGVELEHFMHEGLYAYAPAAITWDPKRLADLSVEALHSCQVEGICPELASDFQAFEQVLRLCIEKYEDDEDNPRVEAVEVQARLGLSERELQVANQLMLLSGLTGGSGAVGDPTNWFFTVSSNIRAYRNAATTDDYFRIRDAEHERYRQAQRALALPYLPPSTPSLPDLCDQLSTHAIVEESFDSTSYLMEESLPAIFICYRREDTIPYARGLAHDLKDHFGAHAVFLDITGIDPGMEWPVEIQNALSRCKALLAVIGPQWLTIAEPISGRRRLDNESDWVRREIAEALDRKIRLMPILVHHASMPKKEDLPNDIKALADKLAHEISDTRWDYDVGELIKVLERVLGVNPD